MRSRQYTAALHADDGRLTMSTLAYADELVPAADVEELAGLEAVEVSEREVRMAEMLVESLTAETDGAADGFLARPIVTVFELQRDAPLYPYIESADEGGLPIPWTALSGLSADPADPQVLWAVSDSALAQAYAYRIDISRSPAVITDRLAIGGVDVADQETGDFDLEGIAVRPEGGLWLASEGRTNAGSSRPNLLVRADAGGAVLDAVRLPDALVAAATSSGFEGVAVTGTAAGATRWSGSPSSASGPTTRPGSSRSAATTWPACRGRSPTTASTTSSFRPAA